jgi:hypothetical protein
MSFNARREDLFINPLSGHTTTFLVKERRTNLTFARNMLSILVWKKRPCTILDIDALYSSNSDYVFGLLSEEETHSIEIVVPRPGSNTTAEIADLLGSSPDRALIIDSLNSLYHLLSTNGRSSKNRNLTFVLALLSFIARTERKAIFFTMYQRGKSVNLRREKPISHLSDFTVVVNAKKGALSLKCERGLVWPGGALVIPNPCR